MTTANKITLVRIALIPFFVWFAMQGDPVSDTIALVLFCVASVTDFLDGYVARHYNQVTDFGKFVDPLADKLLVTAALVLFAERLLFPAWMGFIILAREFIITSLRNVAAAKGQVMAAAWSGKVKTCVQIAAIICIFLFSIVTGMGVPLPAFLPGLCAWVATLVTLYSGYDYLHRNWELVAEGATKPKL